MQMRMDRQAEVGHDGLQHRHHRACGPRLRGSIALGTTTRTSDRVLPHEPRRCPPGAVGAQLALRARVDRGPQLVEALDAAQGTP